MPYNDVTFFSDKTPHSWPMDEINTENDEVVGTTAITGPTNSHPNFLFGLDGGHRLNALRLRTTYAYANLGLFNNDRIRLVDV